MIKKGGDDINPEILRRFPDIRRQFRDKFRGLPPELPPPITFTNSE